MSRTPSTRVRSITHLSLVDRVTDELHRAILNGDIAPGSTVSIVELCKQFDVSHIPVREALRRLESEGLLSLRPGRSAVVSSLSQEDLTSLYNLRALIESDIVLRATPLLTDQHIAAAEAALEDYATVEREASRLAETHRVFHEALLDHVLTDADRRVLDLLWTSTDRYLHLLMRDLDSGPETTQKRIDEHVEILALARKRDAEGMRKEWVDHLRSSEVALSAALSARA